MIDEKFKTLPKDKETLIKYLKLLVMDWFPYIDVSKIEAEIARRIGIQLNALGGIYWMREAYYAAKQENPCASALNVIWDGIGEWVM